MSKYPRTLCLHVQEHARADRPSRVFPHIYNFSLARSGYSLGSSTEPISDLLVICTITSVRKVLLLARDEVTHLSASRSSRNWSSVCMH